MSDTPCRAAPRHRPSRADIRAVAKRLRAEANLVLAIGSSRRDAAERRPESRNLFLKLAERNDSEAARLVRVAAWLEER